MNENQPTDVLVKVQATLIVRVPNKHPDAQATDGLNEMFREADGFVIDWGYADTGETDVLGMPAHAQVLSLNPDTYEEGDAWATPDHIPGDVRGGTCPRCGALYGEMGHDPEPCEGAS